MLVPAIERITRRVGRPPPRVTADPATANNESKTTSAPSACAESSYPARANRTRPTRDPEPPRVQEDGAMAHRLRRPHQLHERDFGLARTRQDGIDSARTWCRRQRLRPQPRQSQVSPHNNINPTHGSSSRGTANHAYPHSRPFSGRSSPALFNEMPRLSGPGHRCATHGRVDDDTDRTAG